MLRMIRCRLKLYDDRFAVIKTTKPLRGAFAVVDDGKEVTCVIRQSEIQNEILMQKEKECIQPDFRLITFDTDIPFETVGFIAEISKALSDEGISLLVFSSYSTDHILIREKDYEKALKKLVEIGFWI
jgi:hypothetical protein